MNSHVDFKIWSLIECFSTAGKTAFVKLDAFVLLEMIFESLLAREDPVTARMRAGILQLLWCCSCAVIYLIFWLRPLRFVVKSVCQSLRGCGNLLALVLGWNQHRLTRIWCDKFCKLVAQSLHRYFLVVMVLGKVLLLRIQLMSCHGDEKSDSLSDYSFL